MPLTASYTAIWVIARVRVGWIAAGWAPLATRTCCSSWFHWITWSGCEAAACARAAAWRWCEARPLAMAVIAKLATSTAVVATRVSRLVTDSPSWLRFVGAAWDYYAASADGR